MTATKERTEYRLSEATSSETVRHVLALMFRPVTAAWNSQLRATFLVGSLGLLVAAAFIVGALDQAASRDAASEKRLEKAEGELHAALAAAKTLTAKLDALESDVATSKTFANAITKATNDAEKKVATLEKSLQKAQCKVATLAQTLDETQKSQEATALALKNAKADLELTNKALTSAQTDLAALKRMRAATSFVEGVVDFPLTGEERELTVLFPKYGYKKKMPIAPKEMAWYLEGEPIKPGDLKNRVKDRHEVLLTLRGDEIIRGDIHPKRIERKE